MAEIQLSDGSFAEVDDEHFAYLNQWAWTAKKGGKSGTIYAYRRETVGGKQRTVRMHRVVLERMGHDMEGMEGEHADMNGLNNRSANLRPATHAENQRNKGCQRNSKSGVKGVSFDRAIQRYRAVLVVNGKKAYSGIFDNIEDAKDAYRLAAIVHHGQFARDADGEIVATDAEIEAAKVKLSELKNRPRRDSTTGYTGVKLAPNGNFVSRIETGGKQLHLGTFSNPIRAAFARDCKAIELQGNRARLNFPFLA